MKNFLYKNDLFFSFLHFSTYENMKLIELKDLPEKEENL